jgi:tRNA dimethylallyltransferase
MDKKPRLLIVVGPTAVGKTRLGVELAKRWNGEVISADSMQIYRGMDIGTAKITEEEAEGIPHWGIDLVDPDQPFTVADYQEYAEAKIREIDARGKLPILVGGTGLYVRSITDYLDFTEADMDLSFRQALQKEAEEKGVSHLHDKLAQVDPVTAKRLHPNDLRRVIRALEVYHLTGKPMSEAYEEAPEEPKYRMVMIGLTIHDRELLYERINQRVDLMIDQGLVDEVKRLLQKGYHKGLTSMQAIGYKEIISHLEGMMTLEESIEEVKRGTRRFAKRQLSWFRREKRIHWFDVLQKKQDEIHKEISQMMAGIL